MKCINCKKEVIDGNIYCVHCGEKLSSNFNSEYNYNVDNQKVYDEVGNKVTEYSENVKTNLPAFYEKVKTIISKNKIAAIIGTVAILAVIVGMGIFGYIQGRPVNESQLKSYLIGQNLNLDGKPYEIKDGQIKTFTVTSRNSVSKQNDKIKGEVTLDIENATVVANVDYDLNYDKQNNKWRFNGLKSSNVKSIEPKIDLNDSIKDLLKTATINYKYDNIDLSKGLLKNIGDINIDGTGVKKSGTAVLTLSNGVIEATVSANFEARFDLVEGKWILNSKNLQSKIIQKEKVSSNLSDDDKKKFALTAFENVRNYNYKYKSGNYDSIKNIVLIKDNISDLKVINFMEYDNTIRVEISGQASSGDMSKINFSGVVNLDLSLSKSSNSKTEVNIDSVELANVNLDSIKKDMLKYKIDDKQITVATADTFNLGSENVDSRMFDKVYEGTIIVNGNSDKIKSRISLEYNDKNKKYEWKLENIDIIKK